MRTLIIYYSIGGTTELLARNIFDLMKDKTNVDIMKIETEKQLAKDPKKLIPHAIFGLLFKIYPKLKPFHYNPENYDNIIIGSPVWIGNPPPAIRSLVFNNKFSNKNIGLFCTYGSEMGKFEIFMKKALAENNHKGTIGFTDKDIKNSIEFSQLEDFISHFI